MMAEHMERNCPDCGEPTGKAESGAACCNGCGWRSLTIKSARRDIKEQVRYQRPYWNNIVASTLKMVAMDYGKDAANKLLVDCNLRAYGWQEEA